MSDAFDDDYDNDPSEDEPRADKTTATHKLTIEGLPHDAIIEAVYNRIANRTEAKLTSEQQKQIKAIIEKKVDEAVLRIVETRLEAEVNKLIDQGWDEYDTWGQRTGKKYTLSERITTYLQQQVDSYGGNSYSDKKQRVKWYVEGAVQKIFDRETDNIVSEFKKQVRERFTKELSDRVAATIKAALGFS